jgi:hypothetical protein
MFSAMLYVALKIVVEIPQNAFVAHARRTPDVVL